jgi:hypothetical protein
MIGISTKLLLFFCLLLSDTWSKFKSRLAPHVSSSILVLPLETLGFIVCPQRDQ